MHIHSSLILVASLCFCRGASFVSVGSFHPVTPTAPCVTLHKPFISDIPKYHHHHRILKKCKAHHAATSSEAAEPTDDSSFAELLGCLHDMSLPKSVQSSIIHDIQTHIGVNSPQELHSFALELHRQSQDTNDGQLMSRVLQQDFQIKPLRSHQLQSALNRLVMKGERGVEVEDTSESHSHINKVMDDGKPKRGEDQISMDPTSSTKQPLFKDVIVNSKAKRRHSLASSTNGSAMKGYKYGLASNYKDTHPQLAKELDDFLNYMIQPESFSLSRNMTRQESPIRLETAKMYIRHAKLFLGWYDTYYTASKCQDGTHESKHPNELLSIYTIIPNKEAPSTQPIIDYILWLRDRNTSKNYEANILRGLGKLLKFRFLRESTADPSYGELCFQDIPAITELRKLHRDAYRIAQLSPRSSNEAMKWISWDEYLGVIQALKIDLTHELEQYKMKESGNVYKNSEHGNEDNMPNRGSVKYSSTDRRIAKKFQTYLVLAFFSCVPDRQRTFRELELGKSFLREDDYWIIKHGPDDYKTGKTYGDRPPMVISPSLTESIDEFINVWRKCFLPRGNHVFTQIRTGNALTRDSLYSMVARACYTHAGKKVNPHLLRDMIVTHVRDSDASEKELEALALYMGHSIAMQRTSYDRRTMQQKVAPAVNLLYSVNEQSSG